MIKRHIYQWVKGWADSKSHKPLILRGARQVGKTYFARFVGRTSFKNMVEINLEFSTDLVAIFEKDLDPKRIVREIELLTGEKIIPGKTLLFIDEIQYQPRALLALRYFYEQLPELHVMAAGSLLDFAIEQVGVPVGRVTYLWIRPLSFIEFLVACDLSMLVEEVLQHSTAEPMPATVHEKLLQHMGEYMCVGGMPESVQTWCDTHDLTACQQVLSDIVVSYEQDFEKFAKKHQIKYIDLLFKNIPLQLGQPFVYSQVSKEHRKRELAPCVDLLQKAGLVHHVYKTAGNGVPLGAEANLEKFKLIFLDVAITQQILGLDMKDWLLQPANSFINKGAIVEAFVGQEMLAYQSAHQLISLYYWQRDARGSQAEVDYLYQDKTEIIPIEVKSGQGSTLKSMHQFLEKHDASYGLRFSTQNYSCYEKIRSYPLYAIAHALEFSW